MIRNASKSSLHRVLTGLVITTVAIFLLLNFTDTVFAMQTDTESKTESNVYFNDYSFHTEKPYVLNPSLEPKRVEIKHDNEILKSSTYAVTVRDALIDFEIPFEQETQVSPSLETNLKFGELNNITVTRISKERKIEIEKKAYETVTYLDDTKELDTETTVQEGREGENKIVYEYIYKDGILISKEAVREETISKAQNEIIAIGTKKVYRTMTIGSDTFEYWKKMEVYATSYDSNCTGCSGTTATGAKLKKGVCAVDPDVIPLYTKFYVPGYGYCTALDVGGAVKGNKIDLGFKDLADHQGEWSARDVEIYLL